MFQSTLFNVILHYSMLHQNIYIIFLHMSTIFCTFALAEEHFNYLWNYVILKLKASVAPNLRPAISLTFCHRRPGRNSADFLPQIPTWRPWRS